MQAKLAGFTLVELLVFLGLAAVAGTISAPALFQFLSRGYFTNGVEVVVRTLRTAQAYSVSGRDDSSWGVHFEPGKLVLFKGTSYATRDPSFDAETALNSSLVIEGWQDVYFNKLRGLPSPNLNLKVKVSGREGDIKVKSEGRIERP
ncbi:hypothetical protein A2797_02025 [candidate division WWE3 bacterium RIFCSPHIGHO2_01_FULL_48_15]|uniref:General secretion pathway GspH domain-containing protein n=1 Tax=candidate division WWE3 bacterium RIFCSPHIGHO2_01_FULL_48_15 TaxID=1802619 RepID=A0A1F4VGT3_UNCKA|nr:MAG: hypothetical protein A2797_02025 [candidate division WWE3 bacterium RIFCSPHIGHO2_01_FULL_48_15]